MTTRTVLYVMPVYNASSWLEESVQSILDQDYDQIHILCIDDGSTDDSVQILKKYAGRLPNFSFLEQENAGPGAAFNRGLKIAKEKGYRYIARMDADDISLPFRTSQQIALLEADDSVAACGTNASYFTKESESCGTSTVPVSSKEIAQEIYAGGRGVIQGTAIFRTEYLSEIGGYRAQKTPAEDTDIFLRLAEKFKLKNIPATAYRIRICQESHSLGSIDLTRLYHHYYLHLAQLRKNGLDEITYDAFCSELSIFSKVSIYRESISISAYFKWMTQHSFVALGVAILLEPQRVMRRIRKKLSRS